jgi:hypothetical protein
MPVIPSASGLTPANSSRRAASDQPEVRFLGGNGRAPDDAVGGGLLMQRKIGTYAYGYTGLHQRGFGR